jgi:hypothetical protein
LSWLFGKNKTSLKRKQLSFRVFQLPLNWRFVVHTKWSSEIDSLMAEKAKIETVFETEKAKIETVFETEKAKIEKKINLLQQICLLEDKYATNSPVEASDVPSEPSEPSVRRGRPRKSEVAGSASKDGKSMKLPTLLKTLGQQNPKMTHNQITKMVHDYGYETKSSNLSSMVYQQLLRLVKKEIFSYDKETREYTYNGQDC